MTVTNTNINLGTVGLGGNTFNDETLTLAGADTIAAGTLLARNTSTNKLQLFVKGGSTNGNGIPVCVLENETTISGAGDVSVRPIFGGPIDNSTLIIDADGDGSNIDNVVLDQLRSAGLEPQVTTELNIADNS